MHKLFEDIGEFFHILFLAGISDWIESGKVPGLRAVETELILRFLLRFIPFNIHFQQKKFNYPRNNFFFGEIPYKAAGEIARTAEIGENDVIFDLGCGRGKFLFFTSLYTKARCCMGYDLLPFYVETAAAIVKKLKVPGIHFYEKDLCDVDLLTANVVFVHGTTFSRKTHEVIWDNIFRMKTGSRFISVSIGYDHPRLELFAKKELLLSWSRSPVFFYRVIEGEEEGNAHQD